MHWLIRCSVLLTLFFLPVLSTAEIASGEMLSQPCFACHGTDGKSPGQIPGINGKSAEFIERTMKAFRDGKRSGTIMQRHAKGYIDEEIAAMAQYISSLK